MRILHVSPFFYPAHYWGGPIYSTFGLCRALAQSPGIELKVLTTDTAGPARGDNLALPAEPVRYPDGFEVRYCHRVAGMSIAPAMIRHLARWVRWADIVHLSGVYSFPTIPTLLACTRQRKPLVWSPRGELQRWAGSRKRLAKWAWERLCDLALSPARCAMHFTSESEREASRTRIRNASTLLLPNGVEFPEALPDRQWRPNGKLRVLYIGRIDPKKGIENLLRALHILPDRVSLRICGAGDAAYVQSLTELAANLEIAPRVSFSGHVADEAKTRAFADADVCVVPSFTENFGNVVAEALVHGTPVIASTGTPWSALEAKRAGRWVANDPGSLADALTKMETDDLAAMGARGRDWMRAEYSWGRIAADLLRSYANLIDKNRTVAKQ